MEAPDGRQLLEEALTALRSGEDSAALDLVRRAVVVGDDDVNVQVVGARLLFDLGEHGEAQAVVTALADHLEEAEHLSESLLLVTSQLAASRGELEAAEEGLRLGFSIEPENPAWGYVLASVLLKQDRDEEALQAVVEARRHRPDAVPLADLEAEITAWLARKRDPQ